MGEQINPPFEISLDLQGSRQIVQFPPAPPDASLKAAKINFLAAF
jgi:hypothetical protein